LKKQIETLQAKLTDMNPSSPAPVEDKEKSLVEVAYYMQQIQVLEAGKSLGKLVATWHIIFSRYKKLIFTVTSQMMEIERRLTETEHLLENSKRENAAILEKSATMSKNLASVSAELDESSTRTAAMEENVLVLQNRIVELEEQLNAR